MAVFQGDDDYQRLDWALLQNGAISLYHSSVIFAEDTAWLAAHGYVVHNFDCAAWESEDDFHDAVSDALKFPGYYGRNIAAFNDCLSGIDIPEQGGCTLAFRRYDHFAAQQPQFAQWVLEDIQQNSRRMSLWGLPCWRCCSRTTRVWSSSRWEPAAWGGIAVSGCTPRGASKPAGISIVRAEDHRRLRRPQG